MTPWGRAKNPVPLYDDSSDGCPRGLRGGRPLARALALVLARSLTRRTAQAYLTRARLARLMPAKGMCPACGHKMRGPSHLCDPTKIERETKRNAALAKLSPK